MNESNIVYWVWLSSIPGLGPRFIKSLIEYFGDPKIIWEVSKKDLKGITAIPQKVLDNIMNQKHKEEAFKIADEITKSKVQPITIKDDIYPKYLKNIYSAPVMLYAKGNVKKYPFCIAVVGARKASSYGKQIAYDLSYELAKREIVVVSGMARGIDSSAHKGALSAGGETIAVMGCGPDVVYPYENKELRNKIAENGMIVSEYQPGTKPMPQYFPARNRIISGISKGVVIVEAGRRSGSLITAEFALEQGREVFAVPGNANNVNSMGTNNLIKEGAKIVTCIDDIIEEFEFFDVTKRVQFSEDKSNPHENLFKELDKDEKRIVECLINGEEHIDIIQKKCGISMQTLNSMLVILELKGKIQLLPGKIYKLKKSFF